VSDTGRSCETHFSPIHPCQAVYAVNPNMKRLIHISCADGYTPSL
jgi:hypothetical protein